MSKLFEIRQGANSIQETLSVEDILAAENNAHEYENDLALAIEELREADRAIEPLFDMAMSLENDKNDFHRDVNVSLEEYRFCCSRLGVTPKYNYSDNPTLEEIMISKEAITEEGKGLFKKFTARVAEFVKSVGAFPALFKNYNVARLKTLLENIENGELVPVNALSELNSNQLRSKYIIMSTLGYDPNNVDDLIKYLNDPIDRINNDRFYNNNVADVFKAIFNGKKVKPDAYTAEMAKRLFTKFTANNDLEVEDIKLLLMMDMFGTKLSITSLAAPDRVNLTAVNTDVIKLTINRATVVKPYSKNDLIKLLNYGIDAQPDIRAAISTSKKMVGGVFIMHILASLSRTVLGPLGMVTEILVYRFYTNLLIHLLTINKEIINYDKIIINHVLKVTEKK